MQLHHFFVLTRPGAPEAERLRGLGLIEGSANTHPGQGTANRRFFFADAMLELLYVHDAAQAADGPGGALQLPRRAADPAASPFGLVVTRPPGSDQAPFPGWRYCPHYLPPETCFLVGDNSDRLVEPLCVCMPDDLPEPASAPPPANGHLSLTSLRVGVPVTAPSPALALMAACPRVALELNRPHCLELVFNAGREGWRGDLRPALPLVVCR